MGTHRLFCSIFWICIGIYVAIQAYRLNLGELHSPGPGFILLLAAVILIILGVIEIFKDFLARKKEGKDDSSLWTGVRWEKILLVLVGLTVYVYLLKLVGFMVPTLLVMLFLFKSVEPMKWRNAIFGSVLTTVAAYMIFRMLLDVPFPRGAMGF